MGTVAPGTTGSVYVDRRWRIWSRVSRNVVWRASSLPLATQHSAGYPRRSRSHRELHAPIPLPISDLTATAHSAGDRDTACYGNGPTDRPSNPPGIPALRRIPGPHRPPRGPQPHVARSEHTQGQRSGSGPTDRASQSDRNRRPRRPSRSKKHPRPARRRS
jgi:hypothetical protein